MALLSAVDITKSYGLHTVLNGATLHLHDGERVGLVGANGAGKSTLLKIIVGEVEPDGGSIAQADGVRLGYLAQALTVPADRTLTGLIDDAHAHLYALEKQMRDLEQRMAGGGNDLERIMDAYGAVSERFERAGGYAIEHRVDAVLNGLGLAGLDRSRRVRTLSGGEKSRVALALLLLSAPDVLLLDEPTNHLDFASLDWLERYLAAYRGAVLIVSHDRQFLNRTVTAVIEIDEHTRQTRQFSGSYDSYLAAKQAMMQQWRADYARQQDEIHALREAVRVTARQNNNYRAHRDNDKYIPKTKQATHDATVARRVRAAAEKLRRIEADPIPQPPDDLRFTPDFDPAALRGDAALRVSGLTKRLGGRCLLDDVHFSLEPTSRVLLLGENGTGKTTLLNLLAGLEPADAGVVTLNPAVRVGCLAQEGDRLDPAQTVLAAFMDGLDLTEQQAKATLMQSGLFRYDELARHVGELSGGQQRKVEIARLIAGRANLLLLDEPTNSISFDVLEAFETALADFPGAVLAVSHDRRFIVKFTGQLGGQVWRLADGQITPQAEAAATIQI